MSEYHSPQVVLAVGYVLMVRMTKKNAAVSEFHREIPPT